MVPHGKPPAAGAAWRLARDLSTYPRSTPPSLPAAATTLSAIALSAASS
jgi:hypothetical protein